MKTCTAIILSAGSGKRFGSEMPKQYNLLDGKEVIIHTIEKIAQAMLISNIVMVVGDDDINFIINLLRKYKISEVSYIVRGGKRRVDSVKNGIMATGSDYVAIHDGARPFVSPDKVDLAVERAFETGAAILAAPANETIKIAHQRIIEDTPERKNLWFAKTPQVFERKLFTELISKIPDDFTPTDDAQIFEYFGYDVEIVPDYPTNIKITYPHDIEIGKILLKKQDK
ncbi:MAG: 2-C-methyl-D-erythritol 4-phosphate cytidylyltransferase [Candidatus Zixiibacteriota bacterium]